MCGALALLGAACGPADGDPVEGLPGAHHRLLEVEGVRWHWVEAGEGAPLVLLHGMPESWHGWSQVIPGLAERYRVLAIDLPGFGATRAHEGDFSFAGVAERVAALLREIGVERYRLAGHDWGGLVGVWLAASDRPEVLGYAHVAAPAERYDLTRLPDYRDFWLDPPEAPRFLGIADVVVPRIYDLGWRGGHERMPQELLARRIEDFAPSAVADTLALWFRDLELADDWSLTGRSTPPWERVGAPVLLVLGDRDLQVNPEEMMGAEAALAGRVELAIVDDAGHYPASERPEAMSELLNSFFERVETAGGER